MLRRRVSHISASLRFQTEAFLQHRFLAPVFRDKVPMNRELHQERRVLGVHIAPFIVEVATTSGQNGVFGLI